MWKIAAGSMVETVGRRRICKAAEGWAAWRWTCVETWRDPDGHASGPVHRGEGGRFGESSVVGTLKMAISSSEEWAF